MMTIESMDATFERLKWDEDATVSRDLVRAGMSSEDLEVSGTLYGFLAEERNATRVVPPLGREEVAAFANRYLCRCLREDPLAVDFIAQRSCTRYGASWEFVRWYARLFKAAPPQPDALAELRAMLAELYRGGGPNLRAVIADVTLAHLFASAAIRRTFADWTADPVLREGYVVARPVHSAQSGLRLRRKAQPLTKKSRTAIRT
jgi:hypothetical protein